MYVKKDLKKRPPSPKDESWTHNGTNRLEMTVVNDGRHYPMVVDDFKVVDNAKIPNNTITIDTAMMVVMILELCRTMS